MTALCSIGILEAGWQRDDWVDDHGTFGEWFLPLLHQVNPKLELPIWRAYLGELPTSPQDCDAWLITGSPASVYEQLPWQSALGEFAMRAAKDQAVVGICYGHQLLHHIYGGTVQRSDSWGMGAVRYQLSASPLVPSGLSEVSLLASHQDQVTIPAPSTQILGSSPQCPIAFTQIGQRILTIQPHPELTKAQARAAYDTKRESLGNDIVDAALSSMSAKIDDQPIAKWIIDFCDQVSRTNTTNPELCECDG